MMGIAKPKWAVFDRLHQEAWDLCTEGNRLPHWNKSIGDPEFQCPCKRSCDCCCCDRCERAGFEFVENPAPEPEAHYFKGNAELRKRFKALQAKFKRHGLPVPLGNGYGWFHGGGVWWSSVG